ncbi:MAG: HAMP domain-containing histidine kinase [Gemmatimonadaceae bacterium]|nr:HAMP domain-containing histidine kinase [Gemmatimonadaceae bacterium]
MTPSRSRRGSSLRVEQGSSTTPPTDDGALVRLALSQAADAASTELSDARDGGWPVMELRAGASLICAAAEQQLHATDVAPRIHFPPALPAKRLLSGMRRSLLAQSRAGALSAEAAVAALDALESLNAQLEDDAGHRFASRLGGMGGLELIVDVAHDMRSPLGSILFLAEQIRRGHSGIVSPIQERQLGLIYGAALGLSTMASDVIDLARGGETLVQQEPRPFSLLSVFQQVHDIVRPMAEERGLVLRFDSTLSDARIGHGQAVQRVLLNLVTNAVKFTSVGEVAVTATAMTATRVRFEVRDTGRGIPEAVLGTLFDAFRRRLKPGQYIFSSAGLGLSICQNLVRAMNSELLVDSVIDVGSAFQFELELPRHAPF